MPILVDIQVPPHYEPVIDQALLRQAVVATIQHQGWSDEGQVVVVITDDEDMRSLNLEFRNIDGPTDVLSFPGTLSADFVTPVDYSGYLGDVVISYSRAEAQAAKAGHPVARELQLLAIHGVLHLMGLDDSDEEGYQRMLALQNEILQSLAIKVPGAGGKTGGGSAIRQ